MDNSKYWITDETEVPWDLLQAIRDDNIVLFIGAGASMAAPSSLPSFEDLVITICKNTSHYSFLTSKHKSLKKVAKSLGMDAVLGFIDDDMASSSGNTLHDEIGGILSAARSSNSTHQAIINLASASKTMRIVTTNQDSLLETKDLFLSCGIQKPKIYDSPALPVGDDFSGIVNLHGSLRDYNHMIFTDRDFGHAYLTKQFCSRFLTEVFSNFTVLFIGYSHDDPLMKYHARGQNDCKKYILTNSPRNEKWGLLGITPIEYKKGHSEVPRILNAMAGIINAKTIETKTQLTEILSVDPSFLNKHEKSIIRLIFGCYNEEESLDLIEWFCTHAKNHSWCDFFENDIELKEKEVFNKVFRSESYSLSTRLIASWFVEICFKRNNKKANSFGLTTLAKWNRAWNANFIGIIIEAIFSAATPKEISKVLSILCASKLSSYSIENELMSDVLSHNLEKFKSVDAVNEHKHLLLSILNVFSMPTIACRENIMSSYEKGLDIFYIEPVFPADSGLANWALCDWWESYYSEANDFAEIEIMNVFSRNLELYYNFLDNEGNGHFFDSYSYFIENMYSDSLKDHEEAVVIRVIRDILLRCDDTVRESFITKYQTSIYSLFVRLCLVALSVSATFNENEKIIWLINNQILLSEKKLLFADFEVKDLLKKCLPFVSKDTKEKLLEYIKSCRGKIKNDGEEQTWHHFKLCCWIKEIRSDWSTDVDVLINQYRQEERWSERQDPLKRVVRAEWVPEATPEIRGEEFIASFHDNAIESINNLFNTSSNDENSIGRNSFDRYNSQYQTIIDATSNNSRFAFELWDFNFSITDVNDLSEEIKFAILEVLKNSIDIKDFGEILSRLLFLIQKSELDNYKLNTVLLFIYDVLNKNENAISNDNFNTIIKITEEVWSKYNRIFLLTGEESNHVHLMSINYWPCSLIFILVELLEIINIGEKKKEIPDEIIVLINEILDSKHQARQYALHAIFMNFRLFYYFDESLANEKLMPIVNMEIEKYNDTWFAWSGFLVSPRVNNRMLGKGLISALFTNGEELYDMVESELQRIYISFLVNIISFLEIKTSDQKKLLSLIAQNKEMSSSIISHIKYHYSGDKVPGFDIIWRKWMKKYIQDRLLNKPKGISQKELFHIASLAFFRTTEFVEISNLLEKSKQTFDFSSIEDFFSFTSKDTLPEIISDYPKETLGLVCYILGNHKGNISYSFSRLVNEVHRLLPYDYKEFLETTSENAGLSLQKNGDPA